MFQLSLNVKLIKDLPNSEKQLTDVFFNSKKIALLQFCEISAVLVWHTNSTFRDLRKKWELVWDKTLAQYYMILATALEWPAHSWNKKQ